VLLAIDPDEPEPWLTSRVAHVLRQGGIAVLPTDTAYAMACALDCGPAIERLYEARELPASKQLSLLVPDISTASRFARAIPNPVFRAMRRVLPGPYTFIFAAGSDLPRVMLRRRRTVGIRIPASAIVQAVLAELGAPLLSASVRSEDDQWTLDPVTIDEELRARADLVVNAGPIEVAPSTVIDASGDQPILVREGKGSIAALELFGP
jgi:tRNA threonylcarbamoyl adenosine modification protein (Sua5/YciO/YrdC/YwlC family)